MSVFEAVWPIEDVDQTLAELLEDARADLPDLLWEAGAVQAGPMTFAVDTRSASPRLLAVCPAAPWIDPALPRCDRPRARPA